MLRRGADEHEVSSEKAHGLFEEVTAGDEPFVVLFDQDDECRVGSPTRRWGCSDDIAATADLFVDAFEGVGTATFAAAAMAVHVADEVHGAALLRAVRVRRKRRKRRRVGDSTVAGNRFRAQRPDHVWAFDFQFDVTDDGRSVKLLYVVDEFTREALAMKAERQINGDDVVAVLDEIVRQRGTHPTIVRCDNGPEMTSSALRDWCRFSRTGASFIEPGSPWENPFVESFNSRVRDELLAVEVFSCLTEAQVMIEDVRQDYNRCRPHRAHGMITPAAFKAGWAAVHDTTPASSPTLQTPTNQQLSQQAARQPGSAQRHPRHPVRLTAVLDHTAGPQARG